MSTATASDHTAPLLGGSQHFLLRRLHSLTGILFGGYLVVHIIINATIAQLGDVYQVQVDKIHGLPMLWALEWGLIYLPILFHTFYGVWIIATGQWNVGNYPYAKNWYYVLQRVSAVIIVLFMFFHVFSLKVGIFNGVNPKLAFDPHHAVTSIHNHLNVSPLIAWGIYPIGILASCYHLANGFWTAAITWGLTVSAGSQKRFGYVCAGFFVVMLALGFISLVSAVTLTPPPPHAAEVAI